MGAREVTIEGPDGRFMAYLAAPEGEKAPGVVVIQEIFGVNAVMREIADGLAADGFAALCPDLFWRQEPGVQLTDQSEAEWQRAFEFFNGFKVDAGVRDIEATIGHLRGLEACTGKVGAIGFCLGGLLAYLAATRTSADAAVGYYGVGIQDKLDEAANISKPLMLHIAEEDEFVSKDAQRAVRAGLGENALTTIHDYPGMDHAFARRGGQHYDRAAADLANSRTREFLGTHLGAKP